MTAVKNTTVKSGGTVRWQAPELFDPDSSQQNSMATDIYSFGCVCYEVRAQPRHRKM
jgi:serine/threonine protein kinase